MRAIEFRAIDRDSGKMIYSDETSLQDFFYGYSDGQFSSEPMQFIGLLDKNGKKIFEGDIVRQNGVKGIWNVYYFEKKAQFRLEVLSAHRYTKPFLRSSCFDVIGNKFENPEIMEKINV